jgi:hypothetical protein
MPMLTKRCNVKTGEERFGSDDYFKPVYCLLPKGHDGPHADWTAWLGVNNPDFSSPGASRGNKSETKKSA